MLTTTERLALVPVLSGLIYKPIPWQGESNDAGVPYSDMEVYRKTRGVFDSHIATVTVYGDVSALVLSHGSDSPPDMKAKKRLTAALLETFPGNIVLTGVFHYLATFVLPNEARAAAKEV